MELQKSVSEVKTELRTVAVELKSEIKSLHLISDQTNTKIDQLGQKVDEQGKKLNDLVKWKHMILGGAVTIGFLIGIGLAIFKLIPWPL